MNRETVAVSALVLVCDYAQNTTARCTALSTQCTQPDGVLYCWMQNKWIYAPDWLVHDDNDDEIINTVV